MRKLTLVVNCTDRKSLETGERLRIRSLSKGDESARFSEWGERLRAPAPRAALTDLYQGEAWTQVKGLVADATRVGYSVRPVVASAGLGLRDATTTSPAYGATFASGHADSVGVDSGANRRWWHRLRCLNSAELLTDSAGSSVLLVLSEAYARAMEDDLVDLARSGGDFLLVGGARDIEGLPRIPADGQLRTALGGTMSSLNTRTARSWLARRTSDSLYEPSDERGWRAWSSTVRKAEDYGRAVATDDQLMEIISQLRRKDSALSATRALRILRDSGTACEQKRFSRLFKAAAGVS